MRATDRTKLIQKALGFTEESQPATVVFPSHPTPPIPCSRSALAETAALRAGGYTDSAPSVFLIRRALLPAGLVIEAKKTRFTSAGRSYLVDAIDDQPNEPQVRVTVDLSKR